MSNRSLATGVFRAWGVMWSISALLALPQFLNGLLRHSSQWSDKAMESYALSSQGISLGCEIVVAVFLLRKASWLADIVFLVDQEFQTQVNAQELSAILFAVVGLYFLLDGVRLASAGVYHLFTKPRDTQNAFQYLWERDPAYLAKAVGSMIAGSVVFFGLGRRRGFWKGVREAYQENLAIRETPDEE